MDLRRLNFEMHHPVCHNQPMKKQQRKKKKRKKFTHIKTAERLEIAILLRKQYSHRDIATVLGRDHTTISREISRNSVRGGLSTPQGTC